MTSEFILRTTLSSPYGRKIRIAADVLGLEDCIEVTSVDTMDEYDSIRTQNPLGKMPCLVLPDGGTLYDSSIILEFLQHVAVTDRLLPRSGMERFSMLTQTRLADGIIDAGALIIYEHRFRELEQVSERWLSHQRGKILRALAAFEAGLPDPLKTDAVTIGLACALGFLDKRQPVDWRPHHPALVDWFAVFTENEPAFERTRAPAI